MSKYDKMIEENQRKSKEKIELALQAIQDMQANKERISVGERVGNAFKDGAKLK